MLKACPRTGKACPIDCIVCRPVGSYGTRNPNRDLVAHNRWARAIKRRDGYRCQGPGPHGGPLEAHHIYGISHPAGVTLCHLCHQAQHDHAI
jgi:hypothetical protein